MERATPLAFGGTYYLESVSVGRDDEDATVWDCPLCGGRGYADEWHLVATVLDTADGTRRQYRCCDDDCLRGWLRSLPAGCSR